MPSCYKDSFGDIIPSIYIYCGVTEGGSEFGYCCGNEPGHTCLSNGFCYYPEVLSGGSHYYLAECTDPEYKDPSCPPLCTQLDKQDVVWNSTSKQWRCCGSNPNNGDLFCDNPAGDSFSAPPPDQLYPLAIRYPATDTQFSLFPSDQVAAASLSVSALLSSLEAASATTTVGSATSTASNTAPSATGTAAPSAAPPSDRNDAGVIAGAVVGSVAGVAILAATIFFLSEGRRQRQRRGQLPRQELPGEREGPFKSAAANGISKVAVSELPSHTRPIELHTEPSELPAHHQQHFTIQHR